MKAFVIKNKEGKYLQYFTDMYRFDFTDRLINAMFYEEWEQDSINYALKTIPDCDEVVEIEIEETKEKHFIRDITVEQLREENKQLEEQHDLLIDEFQKEREELCKQIKQESDARERFVEKVKRLKEQLAEKDKEIRKQVCNNIREKLGMNQYNTCENTAFGVYYDELKEILDQIEQAKESMK